MSHWRPDPDAVVYVWRQVADHIVDLMRSGELPVGARLPGERDLADEYGVAVATIRRAVKELRDQGLLTTVPVRGTFVVRLPD